MGDDMIGSGSVTDYCLRSIHHGKNQNKRNPNQCHDPLITEPCRFSPLCIPWHAAMSRWLGTISYAKDIKNHYVYYGTPQNIQTCQNQYFQTRIVIEVTKVMNVKNSHKTFSAFDVFNECQPYSHKGTTSNFKIK